MQLFDEMTREAIREQAPEALAVLPVGATEQHGPHLPVGTDRFAVEAIARAAAQAASDQIPVIVTPTLPFGSSSHHLPFSGTMSLTTETYLRVVMDLAESLITDGFQRIFILNGHGGNHEIIQLVARDLALKYPAHLAAASYWTIAWEGFLTVKGETPGRMPGHAGIFETSLVMALRPELISEPRPHRDLSDEPVTSTFAARYRAEHHGSWQEMAGYTDSPDQGTADLGRAYLDAAADAVSQAFIEFYTASGGTRAEGS
ncbi:MAG TPA: creatininase family protein [Thermomicrobiales bacterium]|nr:creatininase family protein [Thermomicrobiales bacterium]